MAEYVPFTVRRSADAYSLKPVRGSLRIILERDPSTKQPSLAQLRKASEDTHLTAALLYAAGTGKEEVVVLNEETALHLGLIAKEVVR